MNIKLTEDVRLPAIGFGTYLISNEDAKSTVQYALRTGYRHIDTAEGYQNERGVGIGLKEGMEELGLSREDIYVTTKVWPGYEPWGQPEKTYDTTIKTLNNSLENLQLDYVDLLLIHAPSSVDHRLDQWRALVDLKKSGKVKAIGVSNYGQAHINEILDAGLPTPDANQIELHPWSQKPDLVAYLREHDIAIIAYSSLVPLSTWRAAPGEDSAKTDAMTKEAQEQDFPFKVMAEKYGVSEAQVLLRWALQKGYAVLPKSTKEARIEQNFDLLSFEIDTQDMEAIEKMDRGDGVAWSGGEPTKMF